MKIILPNGVVGLLLLLLLITTCQASFAQARQLQKLEYAFDADPGPGKATGLVLPATATIDSVFTFNTSTLRTGIHILYYRVQDTAGKWSLTQRTPFLTLAGSSAVAQLKSVEYSFDSDAGPGQGSLISLPAVGAIDSLFTIPVNNISDGLHRLFYRVQDLSGNWSLTQKASFLKFPGKDSASLITQMEYFLDTDPGIGKGIPLSFVPGNNTTDTFNISIPANGKPARTLYLRAGDNRGAWSLGWSKEVKPDTCQKVQPDFSFVQFGNRYSFSDIGAGRSTAGYLWKFFNNNTLVATSAISHPQIDLPPGQNKVRLIKTAACGIDSIEHLITTGKITSYYPSRSMAGGDVIIALYGAGLDTSAKVFLKQQSSPANFLIPNLKVSKSAYQLTTYFDLHNVTATGAWFIEVIFASGLKDTLTYQVDPADNADPVTTVSIDGPPNMRTGVYTSYNITVTNTGGKFAKGVPLWILVPNGVAIDFSAIPTAIPSGYNKEVMDSIPQYLGVDSAFGRPFGGAAYCIWLSGINARQSITIPIKLYTATTPGGQLTLFAFTDKRLYGSPLSRLWGKCFDDILFTALGIAPVIGCGAGLFDFIGNSVDQLGTGEQHYASWGSYFWGAGTTLFGCIPVIGNVGKLGKLSKMLKALGDTQKYAQASRAVGGVSGAYNASGDCGGTDEDNANGKPIRPAASRDPNAIYGPEGYGTPQYLASGGKRGYTVHFENLAAATANAQQVFISDTLDKTKFDLANFQLVSFSIGDSTYFIPPALQQYTRTVAIKQFSNVNVLFNAKMDTATGILHCSYLSINPATGELVDSTSLLGFLPPNTTPLKGEGAVSYSVSLKKLASGTVVPNRAGIVFDRNSVLLTNTWNNTMDTTRPANPVLSTRLVNDSTIKLSMTASDLHAGIKKYIVYAAVNNGNFIYAGEMADTARFVGQADSSYTFYAVPVDNVGNNGPLSNQSTIKLQKTTATGPGKLLVYPNPVQQSATIVFNTDQQQTVTVRLYAATGELVASLYEGLANGSVRLTPNLNRLANGMYILHARGDKGLRLQTKLLVQR